MKKIKYLKIETKRTTYLKNHEKIVFKKAALIIHQN
jgi:hypothetical protein